MDHTKREYCGLFHFTFWRMGKWIDVVVDDLLPTENGNLLYAHSKTKNEFWSALLEKAIAKVNGSYESLTSGSLAEALVDLTGGVPETINLQAPKYTKGQLKILKLFDRMKEAFSQNALMAAAIAIKDLNELEEHMGCGLVKGHSYAITAVKHLKLNNGLSRRDTLDEILTDPVKNKMIRLHNPWGEKEWNGPWSDGSEEWNLISEKQKKSLGLFSEEDGEFWMTWSDFCQYFTDISICHLKFHGRKKYQKGHST